MKTISGAAENVFFFLEFCRKSDESCLPSLPYNLRRRVVVGRVMASVTSVFNFYQELDVIKKKPKFTVSGTMWFYVTEKKPIYIGSESGPGTSPPPINTLLRIMEVRRRRHESTNDW